MLTARVERFADRIDAVTDWTGRRAAWLVLAVVVLLFAQLPLREVFGGGQILANDFGQILHAAVFIFGLSYALRWDRHVRMDVFYRRMSPRRQAAVTFFGTLLFLLPWCALMVGFGWSYAVSAVRALEIFSDTWSPGYFMFKVLLVVPIAMPSLLAMGADPIWLSVLLAITVQTSFLMPPTGFALFFLRSVAPAALQTTDIYRGAVPLIAIQLVVLTLLISFPVLATWLPGR